MIDTRKADIFTVRPRGETDEESRTAITIELQGANIEAEEIHRGHTQPDGSTVYYVYLGGQ